MIISKSYLIDKNNNYMICVNIIFNKSKHEKFCNTTLYI